MFVDADQPLEHASSFDVLDRLFRETFHRLVDVLPRDAGANRQK